MHLKSQKTKAVNYSVYFVILLFLKIPICIIRNIGFYTKENELMISMKKYILVPAFAATVSVNSYAEINLSGFGTFAAGQAFGDESVTRQGVDGYTDEFSAEEASFVGMQVVANIYGNLGATLQLTSEGSKDWEADLTWAFLSYDIMDEWRVILGRQRMPHYLYSDYLDVSFAYHWIAAPSELYNAPFNSLNGISSLYTFDFENSSLFTQVLYGEEPDYEEDIGGDKTYEDIMGAKLVYNYDWLTVTTSYFEFQENTTTTVRVGRTRTEVDIDGVLTSLDVGVQIDYNDWLIVTEISTVDFSDMGDGRGTIQPWMLSIAKSFYTDFGTVMPHITYGQNRNLDYNDTDTYTPFGIIGTRWDFYPSVALKIEYSVEKDEDDNVGTALQAAIVSAF